MTLNIPIETLTGNLPGIPNILFFAIAFVMAMSVIRRIAGLLLGALVLFAFIYHPDLINSAISTIASLFKQYA